MLKKVIATIEEESCCAVPNPPSIERQQAEKAAQMFAALADPTRLSILNLLAGSAEEVCVCDITAGFALGQPTISHHLKILKEAGLVQGDKRGKWVYYSLVPGKGNEVKGLLECVFSAPVLSR